MIAVLGQAGVIVALVSAIALAVQGVRSYLSGGIAVADALRLPIWGMIGGAIIAMGALELALVTNDFSIEYVARNHARGTPLLFTIASAWAALEGSIVLWGLVLASYATWVYRRLQDEDPIGAAALAVMGAVAIFFFGLMATAANPFSTLAVAPADGLGANPLLQNHILMAIHPRCCTSATSG